ncbi:MAG: Uncharacterised protein [Polaribacter sp. SA4-10]|nr:MAG: Uncharacterised protein [Polaribacter sp. SA4-10]
MNKGSLLLLLFFSFLGLKAQEKKKEMETDTVKTEVVNVITAYNPKIADANKIQRTPEIKLSEKSKKKQLKYTISSIPVASTFMPKTGVVKGIDVGVKERVYDNYIAGGFGNYNTPFVEAALHYDTRFKNEMGFYAKYISSNENVENTALASTFSNFKTALFFKQQERYFDWKVSLNSAQNKYNWYGIPENLKASTAIETINSEQENNYFQLIGAFDFENSILENSTASISSFSDAYQSKEIVMNLETIFNFSLDFINYGLNPLSIDTSIEVLKGFFKSNSTDNSEIDYSIITTKILPTYNFMLYDFSIKTGLKLFASVDTENSATNILVYPDVQISKAIIKDAFILYTGISGDLKTNTYKSITEENPYVSPTLFITQTSEKMNVFLGTSGKINNNFSFNFKASYKDEEDKAFFIRNNSKSNGINLITNNIPLENYEFGNSFRVSYDDVTTTSLLGEFEYDVSNKIATGATIQYDDYQVKNLEEAWNLPALQIAVFGKYKSEKWYATTNIFYVSERKTVAYNAPFPSSTISTDRLDSFVDFNLNGGYHFNDAFSVFLKLNNVLNTNYQRFTNFDVQGVQVLGGITYKFDF